MSEKSVFKYVSRRLINRCSDGAELHALVTWYTTRWLAAMKITAVYQLYWRRTKRSGSAQSIC